MEKDVLSAIMEVEEEIQERLVAEQRNAGAELCRLGREIEDETRREEAELTAAMEQAVAAAREMAREQGAAIVLEAETRAARMTGLGDETLEPLIMRHLVRILPGER